MLAYNTVDAPRLEVVEIPADCFVKMGPYLPIQTSHNGNSLGNQVDPSIGRFFTDYYLIMCNNNFFFAVVIRAPSLGYRFNHVANEIETNAQTATLSEEQGTCNFLLSIGAHEQVINYIVL